MKKVTLFLLSFILMNSMIGFGQQSIDFTGNGEIDARSGYFTRYVVTEKYFDITGTPYYNVDWEPGKIKLKTGVELKLESCKYDVFEGKLIFKKDEMPLYFSSPQDIISFTIGDSKFINLKQKKDNEFYESILDIENLQLLKEYNCVYVEGKETDGINPATRDKYAVNFEYFVKRGEILEKIKLKEKAILEFTGDKKNVINEYIKKNKLNCKKEDDVIKVLEFYSTLI